MNTFFSFFQRKFSQFHSPAKSGINRFKALFGKMGQINLRGFSKNPFFYFGFMSFVLFGLLSFGSGSLAGSNYVASDGVLINQFFKDANMAQNDNLFFSQQGALELEAPDLKIAGNFLAAVPTTSILTTQTLGNIFGGSDIIRKEIVDYTVLPGDTMDSLSVQFQISKQTIAWANDISENAALKTGQTLVILPVSGIIHIVKSGDTIDQIAKTYKVNADGIITFNELGDGKIFIGDSLIIENGQMPKKAASPLPVQIALPNSFFIFPVLKGLVTQGLHYFNAIDVANSCGTPIYAAASGIVQRAVSDGGCHSGEGNHITILHSNGTVTYYGHLETLFVKSGDRVNMGDRIGSMGHTGKATGCHVHFQVIGAQNPLSKFTV